MIQIRFKNDALAKSEYITDIRPKVALRLEILKTSIEHLSGINISNSAEDFLKYKHITRKIINSLEKKDDKMAESKFDLDVYEPTVIDYLAGATNKLSKLNLSGLDRFIKFLLASNEKELEKLLTCPANDLAAKSEDILKKFKIKSPANKAVIKLAFDYTAYDAEISKFIRDFFRTNNIVIFCPYCNLTEADYSETPEGETATIHYLDHFFDKATTPLLCYSMFNLVPSDGICNSINKSTNNFDDIFHLNPYISGFGKDRMVFEPIIGRVGEKLYGIDLKIIPPKGDPKYRQLIGDELSIRQSNKQGNINVFKLHSKYNRDHVLKKGGNVIRKINDLITTRTSLTAFLDRMKLKGNIENYRIWYYEEFETEFDENQFYKNAYSKLIRDFHDCVVEVNTDLVNNDIKSYINKN